jgi:hypothetical protein
VGFASGLLTKEEVVDWAAQNIRFGNMAERRIYSQLFVRYPALVPADE